VYAIVDDLARTATMAAHEQLSNGSGSSSSSKVQDHVKFPDVLHADDNAQSCRMTAALALL
jgi:hypothetical protein